MALPEPRQVYDVFGGSGVVSALADQLGIRAQYSDIFRWTSTCARAILVDDFRRGDLRKCLDLVDLAIRDARRGFISGTFSGCYFTKAENLELDAVLTLVSGPISRRYRDLIFYGFAQAALAKLPMAMFHRACLKQRTSPVTHRSGNLTTWNTPFGILIPRFMQEAVAFSLVRRTDHRVLRSDAIAAARSIDSEDLLFLDPPYASPSGTAPSYSQAYHFLEGFASGEAYWQAHLDSSGSHPVFVDAVDSEFETRAGWLKGIESLLGLSANSTVLATARRLDDPGACELRRMLRNHFRTVRWATISRSTIFTDKPNIEYLFVAS